MAKENLLKKLGKKVIPFLTCALVLSTSINQKCRDDPVTLPQKPVAVLTANPAQGDAPLEVSFDGSQSYAREGYIKEYDWDFDGDGNTDSITLGPYTNYIYEWGGEYDASLVVVDSKGQRSNKDLEKIVVNENILGKIAFWSNRDVSGEDYNEDIYSGDIIIRDEEIRLRNIKRLTHHDGQDLEPAWSPDGKEILFTSHRTGGTAIWRMNEDGTNQRDISSNLVERARQADFGNNGKIVVAYRDLGDTVAGIGIIDSDTNLFTPIYPESMSSQIPGWPKWSPDCSKIVFQKYINENWEIFLMNADGTDMPRNLTNNFAIDNQPVFLSNEEILFWSDRAYPNQSPIKADLYLMNLNGDNVTKLTYAPGGELDPAISPDRKYLLFTSFRFFLDPFQIYLTELANAYDINKWIQLTTKGENRYPAWKPKIKD